MMKVYFNTAMISFTTLIIHHVPKHTRALGTLIKSDLCSQIQNCSAVTSLPHVTRIKNVSHFTYGTFSRRSSKTYISTILIFLKFKMDCLWFSLVFTQWMHNAVLNFTIILLKSFQYRIPGKPLRWRCVSDSICRLCPCKYLHSAEDQRITVQ